ncbi:unnamed protein product [Rotaria sp. Silwood1]|nr:unnamed protein product [Rotaria sp. Silwood1]CAF1146858.1 unnamed protein product [Rotaria sp. Silwood1]
MFPGIPLIQNTAYLQWFEMQRRRFQENHRAVKRKGAVEIDPVEHIYAHPDCTDKLKDFSSIGVQTLYDVIQHGLQAGGNRPQFSYRKSSDEPFQSYTYKDVLQIMQETGSGIASLGLKISNKTFIGIYGSASVNYALTLYSCWPFSLVPIGIYDSLGQDGVRYIIRHAEVKLIFADELTRVHNLIEWKDDTLALKIIITFIEPTSELLKAAEEKNLKLLTYDKLREIGRNNLIDFVPPNVNDTALIMYTSGSTGEPKGCIITHENFITAMFGCAAAIDLESLAINEVPRALNFLPMAHMFGCGTVVAITYLGGEVGFWQGKVDKLLDDFRDFRPTLLSIVPRLLNRLYDKVRSEILKKGLLGRILFRLAIYNKLALIRRGDFSQNTIWDKILFDKIRRQFGGQIRRVVSSSAPLSAEVCQFARAAFSCFLIEAYGQTECVIGCWQTLHDMESGETGIPTIFNHIKLVDVPEKDYYAENGVGEICIRSKAVFSGYLKDEAKTREVIDDQGWLHTGDVGRWTRHKTMTIIDRKKNMYKLSQGEYIAPEKIEDAYSRSQFVSQLFVYGDSYKNFPVAVVVLNEDYVKKWSAKDDNTRCNTEEKLKQIVLNDMLREGKKRGLMSYEQVKAIEFIKEPFTIENGLLTPTFKSRRFAVEKKYKDFFIKLYKKLDG